MAAAAAAGAAFLAARDAAAVQANEPASSAVPCAVMVRLEGDVQVLDPTRTHLLGTEARGGIPCGGWVSSTAGSALLRHRQGFDIRLGPKTFIEIFDRDERGFQTGPEHVVLYKGKVLVGAANGGGQLRVVTANARARVNGGEALVIFDQYNNETQVVGFSGKATLENRFVDARRIPAQPGEAVSLNLKALRIVPSEPRALNVTSLKTALADLFLSEEEMKKYLSTAFDRKERKFATVLAVRRTARAEEIREEEEKAAAAEGLEAETDWALGEDETDEASRRPAEEGADAAGAPPPRPKGPRRDPTDYRRHRESASDAEGQGRWVARIVGEQKVGEQILFPDKFYGERQQVRVLVTDPYERLEMKRRKDEDAEKKKLIQELSEVRAFE